MREIGGELREPCEGIVESLEHFVEGDRQRLKFARPSCGTNMLLQMVRPDPSEGLRHLSQRLQPAPGNDDRNQSRRQNAAREHHNEQKREVPFDLLVARPVLRQLGACKFGHWTCSLKATNENSFAALRYSLRVRRASAGSRAAGKICVGINRSIPGVSARVRPSESSILIQ